MEFSCRTCGEEFDSLDKLRAHIHGHWHKGWSKRKLESKTEGACPETCCRFVISRTCEDCEACTED